MKTSAASTAISGIRQYIDSPRQAFDELGSETVPTGRYGNFENVMQYMRSAASLISLTASAGFILLGFAIVPFSF